MADADDIPVSVTRVVYTVDPTHPTHGLAQNHLAQWFAPYWDEIERHFREKIAQEMEESEEYWIARGRPE